MIKVLFMGRKRVASDCLEFILAQPNVKVVGVITDHHKKNSDTAKIALSNGLKLLDYDMALSKIQKGELDFDLGISVLYWRKLSIEFLKMPELGVINFHPAILPNYKGVAGYNLAIMENLPFWGVSAHYADENIDTGDIIDVRKFAITASNETAKSLEQKTQKILLYQCKEVIPKVLTNKNRLQTITNAGGRYTSRTELEEMKEVVEGEDLDKKIRAFWFPPYKGAQIELDGQKFTIINDTILRSLSQDNVQPSKITSINECASKSDSTGWPSYTAEEAEAVSKVLLSNKVNYWTGEQCKFFEEEFADFADSKFAIALANGTLALDLALHAIRISHGDEVIVTSRSYVASASCIANAGGIPIFVDVDKNSQNICPEKIKEALTPRTKAIICVHLGGWPCDLDKIMEISKKYNLFVIEDCAQAHGAKYKGRSVGSIGDVGCWSFCQDKIMSTGGEGGMVTTNNERLWSKMWSFKDHGKSWTAATKQKSQNGFKWLHESFGTNYRMTEMQAAIGRIQLKRMPLWHNKRWMYANQIWEAANKTKKLMAPLFECQSCPDDCTAEQGCKHAAYKCYTFVRGTEAERDEILEEINLLGVPCFTGACPEIYMEKAFRDANYIPEKRLPTAKLLGETSLMFLCHPTLTQEQIDLTCLAINKTCN